MFSVVWPNTFSPYRCDFAECKVFKDHIVWYRKLLQFSTILHNMMQCGVRRSSVHIRKPVFKSCIPYYLCAYLLLQEILLTRCHAPSCKPSPLSSSSLPSCLDLLSSLWPQNGHCECFCLVWFYASSEMLFLNPESNDVTDIFQSKPLGFKTLAKGLVVSFLTLYFHGIWQTYSTITVFIFSFFF